MIVVNFDEHFRLVADTFQSRGYSRADAESYARVTRDAAFNGVHSHNAVKALDLDTRFGRLAKNVSTMHGVSRSETAQTLDADHGCGPSAAYQAIDECIEGARKWGVAVVSVKNATHYIWGGSYVLKAAREGLVGFTTCTSPLAEVAPYNGTRPSLGTNPHTWAVPTHRAIGFPLLIDWATSAISMSTVHRARRHDQRLPNATALDVRGLPTVLPNEVAALLPMGKHKGFSLGVLTEVLAAMIGGEVPSKRGSQVADSSFLFLVIDPAAISAARDWSSGVADSLADMLRGNPEAILPGQKEARHRQRCRDAGGLLFTELDLERLNQQALEAGVDPI